MAMVLTGSGTVWQNCTCGLPVTNPSEGAKSDAKEDWVGKDEANGSHPEQ